MNSSVNITTHPLYIKLEKENQELGKQNAELKKTVQALEAKVTWFINQLHGAKSERRMQGDGSLLPQQGEQLPLLTLPELPAIVHDIPEKTVTRKKSCKVIPLDNVSQSGLRFTKELEVVDVAIPNPATEGLKESEYTVISEKVAEKLCQRKGSYFIKRYRQQVIKIKESGELRQDAAPEKVIQSAQADISLLVGMAVDKFMYHLPLYRQHQRMKAQGITVSRASLTQWVHDFIDLFEPVYDALHQSIVSCKVVSMDETPHKAGTSKGKMQQCYYWFLYGQSKEVYIHHNKSRSRQVAKDLLLDGFKGTLLSDGFSVYDSVAKELVLEHANCWAHARRKFIEAEAQEPALTESAVTAIRLIYEKEAAAPKDDKQKYLDFRHKEIKPLVDSFLDWLEREHHRIEGLPGNKYSKAINYTFKRRASLSVFLTNPEVPLDNNHTERAIRPIVLGRKNYLFCWSEIGAEKVAIIQSIILTCQLHGIDPWEYLTDVAPQISKDYSCAASLTPRLWLEKRNLTDTTLAQAAVAA